MNIYEEVLHHIDHYHCIVIICRFFECSIMAPALTIDKKWETHGWWIEVEEPLKAFLWMTDHPFQIGKRTSALGKRFGEIQAITTRPYNDMIYVMCVPEAGQPEVKTSLSKTLLLASIPVSLLQTPGQVKFLNALQKFWLNTSPTVRTARQEHMLACLELSPEDVVRAKKFMSEHIRYEALRQMDPARCHDTLGASASKIIEKGI
jgi:hypothetical protein